MPELLGVPEETLLKAIAIVDPDLLVGDLGTDDDMAIVQTACYAHAFAEWLVGKKRQIKTDHLGTSVRNLGDSLDYYTLVSESRHYLTALALAVCKIGAEAAQ